jgi:signal transduction histidine kinase/tetratricopeptide (TPR) repeat protein
MFKVFAFLFCLALTLTLTKTHAQRDVKDSLHNLLDSKLTVETRIDVLTELSYQYYDFDDSLAFEYANEALIEATKINYRKGIKYGYTLLGLGYASKSEYNRAIASYKKSNSITAENSDGIAVYTLTLLGNSYRDQAKFDSSRFFYDQAISRFGNSEKDRLATIYKNIALLNIKQWRNQEAVKYLDSASAILKIYPEIYTQIDVWSSYGKAYANLLQFDKSQEYYSKVCSEAKDLDDYFHQIKCILNKSELEYRKGNFPQALQLGLEAIRFLEIYAYPPQQVEVLIHVGVIYIELSQFDLANKYLFQALKIAEKHHLIFETAQIYSEQAWIYKDQGNYPLALDYVSQSQKIRESIGDRHGVAICHNIRGLIFYLQKRYQESITEHEKAKKIRLDIQHPEGVAASIFNLSLVYAALGDIDKSINLQKEAISIEEGIENIFSLSISYNHLAEGLISKGRYSEAKRYLERSRTFAQKTQSKLLMRNNADVFSKLMKSQGDFKKALEFKELYQSLDDSIYSEASAGKLAEMQALYQLEKKDQEIQLLSKERALQESQLQVQQASLRQQRILIIAATIGILFISFVAYITYFSYRRIHKLNMEISERNEEIQAQSEELSESNQTLTNLNNEIIEKNEEIQAQSEELIEANQTIAQINRNLEDKVEARTSELKKAYKELDTFFYRSSHDFRRPLTTFMGLAEVAKITVKDQNALELFSKVNDTAHYLDKMLVKLQSISDVGGQELVYKEIFLKEIFDTVCDTFREDLQRKNIKTFCEINLKESFYSYPALLRIIIENLVENSIFFSGVDDPSIHFKAYRQESNVIMEVHDNGEGISGEYLDRIFEMYFRANERSKGNGLGLYIVSKAVEKLSGHLSLQTEVHKGSVFTITFPGKQLQS